MEYTQSIQRIASFFESHLRHQGCRVCAPMLPTQRKEYPSYLSRPRCTMRSYLNFDSRLSPCQNGCSQQSTVKVYFVLIVHQTSRKDRVGLNVVRNLEMRQGELIKTLVASLLACGVVCFVVFCLVIILSHDV
ncbi:hypothetical protein SeLEV6574_g07140 [Synchytrium endobioticum]|uniref:Uncharacterized protein n=1 Tax=Synchytrium endobioticum TaxID=286115 RepID=A0A507CLJ0_9FUNG|nr:hypothetical protein SeLEV6574_g07140 [Synchytrium endobioticum]